MKIEELKLGVIKQILDCDSLALLVAAKRLLEDKEVRAGWSKKAKEMVDNGDDELEGWPHDGRMTAEGTDTNSPEYKETLKKLLPNNTIKELIVHTKRDITSENGIELMEGSGIHVDSETETEYTGIWASMAGSYTVTVKKEDCENYK